ncbi:hypothetical protein [Petroclostridium xylanilyticum]|uniref:hypothetical protein n=1 Tax=Petroclostridium xylanilyticum TaxID=1792311 RepID=UPI0018E2E517|nr:hypothetical protein [Petroclostridium xylanilyticum]
MYMLELIRLFCNSDINHEDWNCRHKTVFMVDIYSEVTRGMEEVINNRLLQG